MLSIGSYYINTNDIPFLLFTTSFSYRAIPSGLFILYCTVGRLDAGGKIKKCCYLLCYIFCNYFVIWAVARDSLKSVCGLQFVFSVDKNLVIWVR